MPTFYFVTIVCIDALWLAWAVVWIVGAFFVKRAVYRQPLGQRLFYLVLICVAVVAMQQVPGLHNWLFFPSLGSAIAGVALCASGLAWCVWARIHLAGNWSASVTIKENHELIQSGPYRLTRHPIYTGILLAVMGTMLALTPTVGGAAGIALVTLVFTIKLRQEETAMLKQFPEAYPAYKKRVRARLVPGVI